MFMWYGLVHYARVRWGKVWYGRVRNQWLNKVFSKGDMKMKWIEKSDRFELSRDEANDLVDLIGIIDRDKKYTKGISGWKGLSASYRKLEKLLLKDAMG